MKKQVRRDGSVRQKMGLVWRLETSFADRHGNFQIRSYTDLTFKLVPRSFSAIMRPIGMDEVAAGDGALHTCSILSVSLKRKSCTSVPSSRTACARIPAPGAPRSESSNE